jgi:hypothetical protein
MDKKAIIQALRDTAQSASNSAASNLSAPVDAIAWALRKAGLPIPENAVGGSDWMEKKGLTAPVKEGIPKMAGEVLGGLAPVVAVAKAPQIAAGANRMIDNAMAPTTLRKESGMFIGPSAKTWDAEAAKKAQTMAAKGADPRKIWSETGTWKGPDNVWRQEIPDNLAGYDPEALLDLKAKDSFNYLKDTQPLGGVIEHPQAYKAYPDMQDMPVHFMPQSKMGNAYGGYSQKLDRLTLSDSPSGVDKTKAAIHEMQHAIQKREGMSGGGNLKGLSLEDYARLAGEAEARATQARIPLTAAQRRAKFPLDSYDVPIDSLIIGGVK